MIITFYHNTIEDMPKISKNLASKIQKKYNEEADIRQYTPIEPYQAMLYKKITEIEITEKSGTLNSNLKLLFQDIEKAMILKKP